MSTFEGEMRGAFPRPVVKEVPTVSRRGFLSALVKGALGLSAVGVVAGYINNASPESAPTVSDDPKEASLIFHEKEVVPSLPNMEVIDGLETYGNGEALSQEDYQNLVNSLNDRYQDQDKKELMRDDRYYGSMFITEKDLAEFSEKSGESIQSYLKRHQDAMTEIFKDANLGMEFNIRRLVVVKEGVDVTKSHVIQYAERGLKDSDGIWYFGEGSFGAGWPNELIHYDPATKIDRGLLHEWGHAILHLHDEYALDVQKELTDSESFPRMLNSQRSYFVDLRTGALEPDLMGGSVVPKFNEFTKNMLLRRNARGELHNLELMIAGNEQVGWPQEMPKSVEMKFVVRDFRTGELVRFSPTSVEVYKFMPIGPARYTEGSVKKIDVDISNFDPLADIFLEKTDQGEQIPVGGGTLLLKLTSAEGGIFYRWLDVRDFNLAAWSGFSNGATMEITVPRTDWEISQWGKGDKVSYYSKGIDSRSGY